MTSLHDRTARLREAVVPSSLAEAIPDWLIEVARPKPAPVPWGAMVRAVLAICVPLSVGTVIGQRDVGLLLAIGGIIGTVIDTGGPYVVRVKRIVSAAVFGGVAGLAIGMVIHHRGWVAVTVLVVVAGVSGLISRLGSTGSATGLTLLIFVSLGLGPFGALRPWWHIALYFVVGVVWALLLLVPGWLLSPRSAEQGAVAAVYHALADELRAIDTDRIAETRRSVAAALNTAYETLLTARAMAGGRSPRMTHLMEVLIASSRMSDAVLTLRLEGTQPPSLVADTIDGIADLIAAGIPRQGRPPRRAPRLDGPPSELLRSMSQHWVGEHLRGHHGVGLHWTAQDGDGRHCAKQQSDGRDKGGDDGGGRNAPSRLTADQQSPEPLRSVPPIPPPGMPGPGSVELWDALAVLERTVAWTPATASELAPRTRLHERAWAVLDTQFDQLRGGRFGWTSTLRLMMCVGVAAVASEVLPLQRSYWVVLTVAIVVKPDYGSVFVRAVQRGAGTVVGAVLGAVILAAVPYGPWLIFPIAALAAGQAYGRLRNFGLGVTFMTPMVVLLIDQLAPTDWWLAEERLVDTLLGCAIVLLIGYASWPSSWHLHLPRQFAAALRDICPFTEAALIPDRDPASRGSGGQLRREAYRALGDLHGGYQQAMSEPAAVSRRAAAWWPAIVALDEVVDAATATGVGIRRGAPAPSPDSVHHLTEALYAVAEAIDAGVPPRVGELPDEAVGPVTDAVRPLLAVLGSGSESALAGAAIRFGNGRAVSDGR
jgi:uncharacterized membrane protein YccC